MRISKREDYAIILISELVKHFGELTPLSFIAKQHKISVLFLRNIALDLRKAGLIEALEGKAGGYKLCKYPSEIRVGEVIAAVAKKPLFSCCQNTKDGRCAKNTCPHGFSLRRLNNDFIEKISKVTLDKLPGKI